MSTLLVKKNIQNRHSTTRGFTLIELMVSLTIFSIVMMISVGTLLIMIDVNAKAQALYSSTTNLSFALDSITREIRTGYHYNCFSSNNLPAQSLPVANTTEDCSSEDAISFVREKDSMHMGYRRMEDASGNGHIEQKTGTGAWEPMTSEDVNVEMFDITVTNSDTYDPGGDEDQPVVDLTIKGKVNNGLETATDFNIQTRIIQRRLDII